MLYLLSFILLLTPLVFVHELGHFLFAKLFGVRVDTFSIGFGPKVFRRQKGETEYCISAIPLGGYVKLLGQDPAEEIPAEFKHRAFFSKEPWKRFLVLLGGPLFNFLFAILVIASMMIIGERHMGTRIGRIVTGSQAFVAGFRTGDVVTAVNGRNVTKFEEVAEAIAEAPGQTLKVSVTREEGGQADLEVIPRPTDGYSIYGEQKKVGDIEGLINVGRYPVISTALVADSPATQAGLKTGDVVVSLNGETVKSYEDLERLAAKAQREGVTEFKLGIATHEFKDWTSESEKKIPGEPKADKEVVMKAAPLEKLGIASSELVVAGLLPDSPAQKAGLQAGDHIISLSGKRLQSFFELREEVQRLGTAEEPIRVSLARNGVHMTKEIKPTSTDSTDALGNSVKAFAIGVYPLLIHSEPDTFIERTFNPITLVAQSTARAVDLSVKTAVSLKKLFFREVSMKTLGGPLLIGKLAGDSLSRGVADFLRAMALISISLAIFNLLPIPVLDGGHIVLLGIEKLRGRPLARRQVEFVHQVGMSFIMLLLVVVLFNDVSRVAIPAFQNVFK